MSWSFGTVRLDGAAIFPDLAELRARTERGDWAGVLAFLSGLAENGAFDDLSYAAGIVVETPGVERLLTDLVARRPDDMLAQVLLAQRHIVMGWAIRTAARAKDVSRAQFATFHEYLRRAERILIKVAAVAPDNPLAWKNRLVTARGLELGQNEARRRYARLAEHHPHHFPAQATLVQQLCPKWGGEWEAAFGFARDCARNAPQGGLGPVVLVEAHLERWLDLGRGHKGREYLAGVHSELVAAASASVLSPYFRARYYRVYMHNVFAMVFGLVGDRAAAAVHFQALGGAVTSFPWTYLNGADPVRAYETMRLQ